MRRYKKPRTASADRGWLLRWSDYRAGLLHGEGEGKGRVGNDVVGGVCADDRDGVVVGDCTAATTTSTATTAAGGVVGAAGEAEAYASEEQDREQSGKPAVTTAEEEKRNDAEGRQRRDCRRAVSRLRRSAE